MLLIIFRKGSLVIPNRLELVNFGTDSSGWAMEAMCILPMIAETHRDKDVEGREQPMNQTHHHHPAILYTTDATS